MTSKRMGEMFQRVSSSLSAVAQPKATGADDFVDISGAENELLYPELQQLLDVAMAGKNANELFALPGTFGGHQGTRTTLSGFFNTYFHPTTPVLPEHVVLTAGAGNSIELLAQSLCDEGDSVIIPAPLWFGFAPYITGRPKVNIITATPPNYAQHAEGLLSAIQDAYNTAPDPSRVKAIILTNPQNPLSRCYPKDVLKVCSQFCHKNGLHLIVDEIYALAAIGSPADDQPDFYSALSLPSSEEDSSYLDGHQIHVVWSPSKLFGLGGLRIGCIVSRAPGLRAAASLLSYAGTSSLSSAMLDTVLSSPQLPDLLTANSERLATSYRIYTETLTSLGIEFIPASQGIFVFARVAPMVTSAEEESEWVAGLEKQGGLRVSPGSHYGSHSGPATGDLPGWARLNMAIPKDRAADAMLRLSRHLANATEGSG